MLKQLLAEVKQLRIENERLRADNARNARYKERDAWLRQLRPIKTRDLSAMDRWVAQDLWAEFRNRQERGITGMWPITISTIKDAQGILVPGKAENIGVSRQTYSDSLHNLEKVGALRTQLIFGGKEKRQLLVEPTDAFWDPSAWKQEHPRNYGHRARPDSPDCGPKGHVKRNKAASGGWVCTKCGVVIEPDATEPSTETPIPPAADGQTEPVPEIVPTPEGAGAPSQGPGEPPDESTLQVVTTSITNNQLGGGEADAAVESEVECLLRIAGTSKRHIRLRKDGNYKYLEKPNTSYPAAAPVTAGLIKKHLEGTLCLGADLRHEDGMTAALCYDADNPEAAHVLRDVVGKRLALAGAYVFWEESPSLVHGGGGHLWIVFDRLVNAADAHATVHSHAPDIEGYERWPSGGCVRLPAGYYDRGEAQGWCPVWLLSPDTGEPWKSATGIEAVRLMMEWQTPSYWVDQVAPPAPEMPMSHVIPGFHSLDTAPVGPDYGRPRPEALDESVWLEKYGDEAKTLWFALTDEQAAALYNSTHRVEDILPPEDGDHALAHWREERTPSVQLNLDDNSWVDYGQHVPKANGKHDGGDALDLYCRVHGLSRSEVLKGFVTELVHRARKELERAAAEDRGPAGWVAGITTPAGWKRFDALRK